MNNVSKKILSQTNKIKDKEKEEKKSLDAPPLDFSYKNIRDLSGSIKL